MNLRGPPSRTPLQGPWRSPPIPTATGWRTLCDSCASSRRCGRCGSTRWRTVWRWATIDQVDLADLEARLAATITAVEDRLAAPGSVGGAPPVSHCARRAGRWCSAATTCVTAEKTVAFGAKWNGRRSRPGPGGRRAGMANAGRLGGWVRRRGHRGIADRPFRTWSAVAGPDHFSLMGLVAGGWDARDRLGEETCGRATSTSTS